VLIGDVTGHGPDEAALGVALRVAWRSLVLAGVPDWDILPGTQRVLEAERHSEDVFATACDMTLHPARGYAEMRIAGHPAPLLVRGGSVEPTPIRARGPLLGLVEEEVWPSERVELGAEWALVLFTDGIVEGRTPDGERLDVEGLAGLAATAVSGGCTLGGLADLLIAGAEHAHGGPLPDDVALFVLAAGDRW
jgi:serine phosphatase RsbU (regulator of sigma subunit)